MMFEEETRRYYINRIRDWDTYSEENERNPDSNSDAEIDLLKETFHETHITRIPYIKGLKENGGSGG